MDRIRDVFGPGPLRRQDRPLWAAARTIDELGELTTRWLAGDIASQPNYYGPVDVDEDVAPGITDALVALNLAGFLTHNSQGAYDGPDYAASPWGAWVYGYADDATFTWLTDVVRHTRFGIHAWPPPASRGRKRPFGGRPPDGGWPRIPASEVRWMYSACGADAIAAVCAAWQVTVYDPEIGSNDLWAHLHDAAANR